jgi:signal transduction histidine kinase
MSSGRLELRRTMVDIADVMQHAVEAMQPMGERVGVTVSAEPFHARLHVDPDRIIQLLTNLVSNAVKFSPAGSEVRVSAEAAEEHIILHVSDQGRGIPPEKLPLIFDRFRQVEVDDAVQKGGAGLGLAISLGIAKAHGGTITVQSEVGVGSVFSVQMPLTA